MVELPPYPGRGVALVRHHDGSVGWIIFLTGRSEASQARTLRSEADRLVVTPTGETGPDPLRHYTCVRRVRSVLVIGNGDHVDHLADGIAASRTLDELVRTIEPEPDPPIHTPRLAVVATSLRRPDSVDVLAARRGAEGATERIVDTVALAAGEGVLVHTYGGDTDDVVTDATPRRFHVDGPGTDVAGRLWHALDPTLRVALAAGLVPSPIPLQVLGERH